MQGQNQDHVRGSLDLLFSKKIIDYEDHAEEIMIK